MKGNYNKGLNLKSSKSKTFFWMFENIQDKWEPILLDEFLLALFSLLWEKLQISFCLRVEMYKNTGRSSK